MGAPSTRPRNSKGVEGILGQIERLGNRLPDPASIFIILAAAVLIFSQLGELFGWKVIHPGTGKEIMVLSLLNGDGFRKIIDTMMNNFAGFAPLPTVLCIMMGVGVAEGSGMIDALLRRTVTGLKPVMVTLAIVFLGINLNAASDAGFIILPPIAAMLLIALGRHPFIGIAEAMGPYSRALVPAFARQPSDDGQPRRQLVSYDGVGPSLDAGRRLGDGKADSSPLQHLFSIRKIPIRRAEAVDRPGKARS